MPLIVALLIAFGLFVAVSTGFCAIYASIEEHWPRWHYALFVAWWWPFRAESAATLTAIAIDADPEEWKAVNRGLSNGIASSALKTTVAIGYVSRRMDLSVGGKDVPLSLWDEHALWAAFQGWQSRKDETARKAATLEAAATFAEAFRSKYGARP